MDLIASTDITPHHNVHAVYRAGGSGCIGARDLQLRRNIRDRSDQLSKPMSQWCGIISECLDVFSKRLFGRGTSVSTLGIAFRTSFMQLCIFSKCIVFADIE